MTASSQAERVCLEYVVVATGILLTGLFYVTVSQLVTVTALLAMLLLLQRYQKTDPPNPDQRPHADDGLWLTLLLPFSLLTGGNSYFHGDLYTLAEVVSSQTLLLSFPFVFKFPSRTINALSVLWTTTLLFTLTNIGVLWSAGTSVLSAFVFQHLTSSLWRYSPRSFTLGELILVCQATTTFLATAGSSIACRLVYGEDCMLNCSSSAAFLQAGLFSLAVLVAAVTNVAALRRPLGFYAAVCLSAVSLVYPLCWVMVGAEPLGWLFLHIFNTTVRAALMVSWMVLTIAAVFFVSWYTRTYADSSTIVRKVFHGVVILVFIPGVTLDPDLMYLACGSVMGVLVLLELVRALRMPPFGKDIHQAFQMFLDEKDAGAFVLTPVYLFVGCATPLLLFPDRFGSSEKTLVLLSGTVSLGIGDTVASVVGSKLGTHRWPGTKKTLEGTLASILAQFAFYFPLLHILTPNVWGLSTGLLVLVLCLNAYLEALTVQVDNLAIPVFMYPMMISLYAS